MPNLQKGCLQDDYKNNQKNNQKNNYKDNYKDNYKIILDEIYCKEPAKSTNINPIRC